MSGLLEEAYRLLVKAEDALLHAEFNYQAGFLTVTVNRAYYSCYYCMTSALLTQNIYTRTHQGTHAKFAELFIKTGVFPVFVSEDVTIISNFARKLTMVRTKISPMLKQAKCCAGPTDFLS